MRVIAVPSVWKAIKARKNPNAERQNYYVVASSSVSRERRSTGDRKKPHKRLKIKAVPIIAGLDEIIKYLS